MTTTKPCNDCDGTGEYVHRFVDGSGAVNRCPTCQGAGRVADEDTVEIVVTTPVPPAVQG